MPNCAFLTERLVVGGWHEVADESGLDLPDVVARVLTSATTSALPSEWHGDYDTTRAGQWIRDRDAESPTLLAVETETGEPIGLLILFASASDDASSGIELRLGYVLDERAWGRGFASEMVGGLVQWARSEPAFGSISGGVDQDNEASARVLLKNGFLPTHVRAGEQLYTLLLREQAT